MRADTSSLNAAPPVRAIGVRNGVGHETMNRELQIRQVEIQSLEAPLAAPFTCASSDLGRVRNLALRVALEGGASGWGEIAILPPITVEDEAGARAALEEEAGRLLGSNAGEWRRIAAGLLERRAAFGSVRAGIETAVLDALTRSLGVALFHFFGGSGGFPGDRYDDPDLSRRGRRGARGTLS